MSLHDNCYQASLDTPDEINSTYIIQKELGKGAYGTVYLAEERKTGEKCAVKRIDDVFRTKVDAKRTLREITIIRQCNHPNIAKLKNILLPKDEETFKQLWVVQEYGGWDLSKVLKSWRRIAGWCDQHVKSIVYQVLCGLLYMQSADLVHRDIKPSNILIDNKCNVKLIDFGLARQMNPQTRAVAFSCIDVSESGLWDNSVPNCERQLTQHVVTRWYRAPELILMQDNYTEAIDIWSVGCVLAELLQTLEPKVTKVKPLFPGTTCFPLSAPRRDKNKMEKIGQEFRAQTHQLEKIFEITGTPCKEDIEMMKEGPMKTFLLNLETIPEKPYEKLLPSAPEEAIKLLRRMLTFNPQKRISVREALDSPYFNDVRNKEFEILAQNKMTFPFENDVEIGSSLEKQRLRQQIYREALIFANMHNAKQIRRSISLSPNQSNGNLATPPMPVTTSVPYVVPKVPTDNKNSSDKGKQCTIL